MKSAAFVAAALALTATVMPAEPLPVAKPAGPSQGAQEAMSNGTCAWSSTAPGGNARASDRPSNRTRLRSAPWYRRPWPRSSQAGLCRPSALLNREIARILAKLDF